MYHKFTSSKHFAKCAHLLKNFTNTRRKSSYYILHALMCTYISYRSQLLKRNMEYSYTYAKEVLGFTFSLKVPTNSCCLRRLSNALTTLGVIIFLYSVILIATFTGIDIDAAENYALLTKLMNCYIAGMKAYHICMIIFKVLCYLL